ncbi:MAG: hypothetical protein KME08_00180 [Aphanothece sp. CMT-3BRIN-NPC111]|jgi:regulator of replication initiation timing|nr:hypothetical protein [Aphanothece sp. CMT-3BRIN-NPC111]
MGTSIYYQALPEQTSLFKRIQTEKPISTIFRELSPFRNGIFYIFELDKEELDDILDWLVEYEEVFDSRADVDRCLNELYMELERAKTSHPGLTEPNAYLDNTQTVIEERLSQELKRRQLDNCIGYVEKLLYGDQELAPQLFDEYDEQLSLVPSSLVQEGTRVLRDIEPEVLFEVAGNREEHYFNDFQWWREFYLEAAARGEAVIIGLA